MTAYSKSQIKALTYGFTKGGALYAPHTLMGGAFRRCCERLVDLQLLNDAPPFAITLKGLVALREVYAARLADRGCDAFEADLASVDAALAQFPSLARRVA